jgi:hypothetical protein
MIRFRRPSSTVLPGYGLHRTQQAIYLRLASFGRDSANVQRHWRKPVYRQQKLWAELMASFPVRSSLWPHARESHVFATDRSKIQIPIPFAVTAVLCRAAILYREVTFWRDGKIEQGHGLGHGTVLSVFSPLQQEGRDIRDGLSSLSGQWQHRWQKYGPPGWISSSRGVRRRSRSAVRFFVMGDSTGIHSPVNLPIGTL